MKMGETYPIEMRIERVLTGVLFATLRTDDDCVLVPKVNVSDVSLQRHFMEI